MEGRASEEIVFGWGEEAERSAGCEGERDVVVFGRNREWFEVKNPRREVKRTVSDLCAPC